MERYSLKKVMLEARNDDDPVAYPGDWTKRLPLRSVRVFPVPIFLKSKEPTSPREAL